VILDSAGLYRLILAYIWRGDFLKMYGIIPRWVIDRMVLTVFGRLVEEALLNSRSTVKRQLTT